MERYIKAKFTDEEIERLSFEAAKQNKSVNQFIHDAAVGTSIEISPVFAALEVAEKLSQIRADLNKIFVRETGAAERLFEDDVIQLDQQMNNIEVAVADYLKSVRKEL